MTLSVFTQSMWNLTCFSHFYLDMCANWKSKFSKQHQKVFPFPLGAIVSSHNDSEHLSSIKADSPLGRLVLDPINRRVDYSQIFILLWISGLILASRSDL